jgi:hypothetical protein
MKLFSTIFLVLITTVTFGQTASDADQVRETLKGASISQAIRKTQTIFFSDAKQQDTIILTVPAGLINKTTSVLTIKTFKNKTIFNERFRTDYFVRGIFDPDTIPPGGQEVYEAYVNRYIVSLSKEQFEQYAKNKISIFLKDLAVSRTELKKAKSYGTVMDRDLYKSIISNPNSKVIWLPCFDCDEGVRYFGYSIQKAKAVMFLEMD